MTHSRLCWFAVLLVALLAPAAWADSISFDTATTTSPDDEPGTPTSPVAGKISAFGTYDVPGGTTVNSITMYAFPPTGGEGGEAELKFDKTNRTWSGSVTSGLTSGVTYAVLVVLSDSNGSYSTQTVEVKCR
jgi:hypothetical protein